MTRPSRERPCFSSRKDHHDAVGGPLRHLQHVLVGRLRERVEGERRGGAVALHVHTIERRELRIYEMRVRRGSISLEAVRPSQPVTSAMPRGLLDRITGR